jgi:hypothetical protein
VTLTDHERKALGLDRESLDCFMEQIRRLNADDPPNREHPDHAAITQVELGFQLDIGIAPLRFGDIDFEKLSFVFEKVGVHLPDPDMACGENGNSGNDVKSPMPVLSGAVMQKLQPSAAFNNIRFSRMRSVVRLYGLKPVFQVLMEWPCVYGTALESSSSLVDRKFEAVFIGGRIGSTTDFSNFENGGIESGPQLIEKFSKLKSELVFGNVTEPPNSDECPVAILFSPVIKSCWFSQSFPFMCKSLRMHSGPVNTLPAIFEDSHISGGR